MHWCCCDQNWELWWYQIHTTLPPWLYSWLMTSNVTILVEEKTCFASFYTLVLLLANMLSLSTLAVYQVSQGSLHTATTIPTYIPVQTPFRTNSSLWTCIISWQFHLNYVTLWPPTHNASERIQKAKRNIFLGPDLNSWHLVKEEGALTVSATVDC